MLSQIEIVIVQVKKAIKNLVIADKVELNSKEQNNGK